MLTRRRLFHRALVTGLATASGIGQASLATGGSLSSECPCEGPDPIFVKPRAITMADLARNVTRGVSATEVSDYVPGHYSGSLRPSPPHADLNPKKAIIVCWQNSGCRLVFSHEASYAPIIELPNGTAICNQWFLGNDDESELFNIMGRKERNSFVQVIQGGPDRVWVRWTYFSVNKTPGIPPRFRGTEDYIVYPNGLIFRRMIYDTLDPESKYGYGNGPVWPFGVLPAGMAIEDAFERDRTHGDYRVQCAIDLYSDAQYDIYFDGHGKARRGDATLLRSMSQAKGCAIITPFKDDFVFTVIGTPSGFESAHSQILDVYADESAPPSWGGPNIYHLGDHWPIGWLNSQVHGASPGSPFPKIWMGGVVHCFIPKDKPVTSYFHEWKVLSKDMALNHWTERRVFYSLLGCAKQWNEIAIVGRAWLDKDTECAKPSSVAGLR